MPTTSWPISPRRSTARSRRSEGGRRPALIVVAQRHHRQVEEVAEDLSRALVLEDPRQRPYLVWVSEDGNRFHALGMAPDRGGRPSFPCAAGGPPRADRQFLPVEASASARSDAHARWTGFWRRTTIQTVPSSLASGWWSVAKSITPSRRTPSTVPASTCAPWSSGPRARASPSSGRWWPAHAARASDRRNGDPAHGRRPTPAAGCPPPPVARRSPGNRAR